MLCLISSHVIAHLLGFNDKASEAYLVPVSLLLWLMFGLVLDRWARQQPCPYCGEPTGIKLVWPRNFICKRCWHDL